MGTIANRIAFLTTDPGARQLATFLEEQLARLDICCPRGSSIGTTGPTVSPITPLQGDAPAKTTAK